MKELWCRAISAVHYNTLQPALSSDCTDPWAGYMYSEETGDVTNLLRSEIGHCYGQHRSHGGSCAQVNVRFPLIVSSFEWKLHEGLHEVHSV